MYIKGWSSYGRTGPLFTVYVKVLYNFLFQHAIPKKTNNRNRNKFVIVGLM